MKNYYCHFFKGDTGKQALKLICLQFLQFLSNFNETLSISFSFQGRLNRVLRSDLTLLHSAHFTTAQRALCTDFATFLFFKLESCNLVCRREFGFREHSYTVFLDNQDAHSAKCALCSSVRPDLIAPFKGSQKKKHLLKASIKSVEN